MNKSQASLFFVPYDIGVVSQWNPKNGQYVMHQKGGCSAKDEVKKLLASAVESSPLQGHDHVIINSQMAVLNSNCYSIMLECVNCARVCSDPSRAMKPLLWNTPGAYYKYAMKKNTSVPYGSFGVPIPASIHFNEHMIEEPWKDWEQERPILVTAWFSQYVQNRIASQTRQRLSKNCRKRPEKCAFIEIYERSGHQQKTVNFGRRDSRIHTSSNISRRIIDKFESGYDFYRHSTFCLHPPGDIEMRKGMFDSFLLGCIPVLFLPNILVKKYPWYFTESMEAAMSVNIRINSVGNVIDQLDAIPMEVIRSKRKSIAEYATRLNYALPPASYRNYIGVNERSKLDGQATWSPPEQDATDVMLSALFERVRKYRSTRSIPSHERALWRSDFDLYWK